MPEPVSVRGAVTGIVQRSHVETISTQSWPLGRTPRSQFWQVGYQSSWLSIGCSKAALSKHYGKESNGREIIQQGSHRRQLPDGSRTKLCFVLLSHHIAQVFWVFCQHDDVTSRLGIPRSALLKPHIHNLKFSDVFFLRSHDRKHKFTHSKTRFATSVPDSKSHPTFVFLDFVVGVCFGNANCQEQ